ncbi:MAG: NUDIX hydrolase [bacterium]|nr:NUDIX hydrolase [bacterium]
MNLERLKEEFVKLKKEELEYIDNVYKTSSNKILSEYEKLEIYRTLNNYTVKLDEMLKRLRKEIFENEKELLENPYSVIIEFDINTNCLSCFDEYNKGRILDELKIDKKTLKFKLNIRSIIWGEYWGIDCDEILVNQRLIDNTIYIFDCYYDSSEDCLGPCFGNPEDYIYGIYVDIRDKYDSHSEEIPKKKINDFEKDKVIIYSQKYISSYEVKQIFEEELLNDKNNSLNDCVIETQNRIDALNYIRSPEYKEKILLEKINNLYSKVKGEKITDKLLYNGNFISLIKEVYKLPNNEIVEKEKVIKNKGKNAVIVIAKTKDQEYIITFQNRIEDKLIAEFPSGYIESNEDVLKTAKRELNEETGYSTDDLFIVDEVYTSPGIDNSITYIVFANNCKKICEVSQNNSEFLEFSLFNDNELDYLITKKIMNGSINKLAYYNLKCNIENNRLKVKKLEL